LISTHPVEYKAHLLPSLGDELFSQSPEVLAVQAYGAGSYLATQFVPSSSHPQNEAQLVYPTAAQSAFSSHDVPQTQNLPF
jgi:hypothetical protein